MNTEPLRIQFLDLVHNPKQYTIIEHFPDASFETERNRIVKTRKQEVDGREFLVCSIFERAASQTAENKLRSFVEMETEKDCRETVFQ